MKTIKLKFVGIDDWNRAVFEDIEHKAAYFGDIEYKAAYGDTEAQVLNKIDTSNIVYLGRTFGCEPIGTKPLYPVEIITDVKPDPNPIQCYSLMLLGRLQRDCDYFLGFGCASEKHLWAGNIADQIAEMRWVFDQLEEKPSWMSVERINEYEKEMLELKEAFDTLYQRPKKEIL